MDNLFDDFDRTDTTRDSFKVGRFSFLNKSAIPEAAAARERIIGWSKGFLIKSDFLKKFRSRINKQHTAALFELFVYHYFKSRGFPIENIEVAGIPTPDFKIETESGTIYVECTCASSYGFDDGIDALQSTILDSFAKLEKQGHYINIEWQQCSHTTPSMRKIRFLIKQFIETPQRSASLLIAESGWRILITLMAANGNLKRGIGFIMQPFGIVKPEINALAAMEEKRPARYKLNSQYIIAVHSEDPYLDDMAIELALYDGAMFQDKLPLNRASEKAFFIANRRLVNTSVSAVLTVQKLNIYLDELPRIKLWHHPEPKYPIDPARFEVRQQTFERSDETNFKVFNFE